MASTLPCPHCGQAIPLAAYAQQFAAQGGRKGGKSCSEAKRRASSENGKLGGRPKKGKKR